MKRKSYLSFLFPKLIASLLAAVVLLGILQVTLDRNYYSALYSGLNSRRERYESIVRNYAEGKTSDTFVDIITTLFASDYFRLAEVQEDGSFKTISETDYTSIPIEESIDHWYFVTNDKELLAKGKRTETINGNEWTIEYKKCDEAWDLDGKTDTRKTNSWDVTAQSDSYMASLLFTFALDYSGYLQFRIPEAQSYYFDGDTLHLGKGIDSYGITYEIGREPFYIKKWDYTDPSKADRYVTADSEYIVRPLAFFPRRERPDEYLNKFSGLFHANNMNELQKAYELRGEDYRDLSFEAVFKDFAGNKKTGGEYKYRAYSSDLDNYNGYVEFYEINGKLYMVEYVIETVSADVYFKPFTILSVIVLAIAAVVIALLASVKPYWQYKKAYENNAFKNNLIDSLAHNMKTPLQILGGYAENLKDVTSDAEKDRYADQILAKTNEMNKDIEAILKTAEKSDRKFTKESIRMCIEEVASKLGVEVFAKGDKKIRMDRDYFKTAIYCLLDNAMKYKSADSKIEIDITCKAVTIKNRTDKDKFTPGTGIAIAGRILEQHKLKMRTTLKDGVFEVKFGKKLGKEKTK